MALALAVVRVGKWLSAAEEEETRMMMMMAKAARKSRLIRSLRSFEALDLSVHLTLTGTLLCLVSRLVRSGVGKRRNTKEIVMRHYKVRARKESERAIGSPSALSTRSHSSIAVARDVCPPVAHRRSPGCRSPRRSPQRPRFPCRQSVSSLGVPHALRGSVD